MPITRDSLLARREELTLAVEQIKAQHTALQGALADVEYWLTQLDPEADEPKPKKGKS